MTEFGFGETTAAETDCRVCDAFAHFICLHDFPYLVYYLQSVHGIGGIRAESFTGGLGSGCGNYWTTGSGRI